MIKKDDGYMIWTHTSLITRSVNAYIKKIAWHKCQAIS